MTEFKSPPSLFYFCIFKDQDIIFFHPPTFSASDRRKHVGLSLGLMNFTQTFGAEVACDNVHSQKHRLVFLRSGEFVITMNINLGFIIRHLPQGRRTIEFLSDSVSDEIVTRRCRAMIDSFNILNNQIDSIEKEKGMVELRRLCHNFFTAQLEVWDFEKMTFANTLYGIRHLATDKTLHTQMISLGNHILHIGGTMENVMILGGTSLACSTFPQRETEQLYHFFTMFDGLQYIKSQQEGFITLPESLIHSHGIAPPLGVHLNGTRHVAFIYRSQVISVILFVAEADDKLKKLQDAEIFRKLDEFFHPNLKMLQDSVSRALAHRYAGTKNSEHVYLNSSTHKFNQVGQFETPGEHTIFASVKSDLERNLATEISLKTSSDHWISARNTGDKYLFTHMATKKDATLMDLDGEVNRVKQQHLSNFYFL